MEYFKVVEKLSKSAMEVCRDELGDFLFTLTPNIGNSPVQVYLSKTEAKDLSSFILKSLTEKQPDEINQPF